MAYDEEQLKGAQERALEMMRLMSKDSHSPRAILGLLAETSEMTRLSGAEFAGLTCQFTAYRQGHDGRALEVSVEVVDSGVHAGDMRYLVSVADRTSRGAFGQARATLREALMAVPWSNLESH